MVKELMQPEGEWTTQKVPRFLCPAMIRVDKLLSYDAVPLETADHLCARR